jgi:hypothetical protein
VPVRIAAQDEPRRRKSDDRDDHREEQRERGCSFCEALQSFVKKMQTGYPAGSPASTRSWRSW